MKQLVLLVLLVHLGACVSTQGDALELEIFVSEPYEINVTSALIMGPSELLVVSAQATNSSARRLAETIRSTGRSLKYIYLTHPHLDHSQGASILLAEFPDAQFIATPEVGALQRASIQAHDELAAFRYGQNAAIPSVPVTDYFQSTIEIDGQTIEIWDGILGDGGIGAPHTALYVPSLHALLPSDTIYFDAHVMMAGSTPESRALSIEQIDSWIAQDFATVVPGHMPKGSPLTAMAALEHTRGYIQAYDTAMEAGESVQDVVSAMIEAYPDLQHQSALFLSTYLNFNDLSGAQSYLSRWKQENPQPNSDAQ